MISINSDQLYEAIKIGNNDTPHDPDGKDRWWKRVGKPISESIRPEDTFWLARENQGFWRSSPVLSVYEHSQNKINEGQDKLILPVDFPMSSDIKLPELKEGDILFATLNSIYLLREYSDCNNCCKLNLTCTGIMEEECTGLLEGPDEEEDSKEEN